MNSESIPRTVVEALMAVAAHTDQGYTFIQDNGQEIHHTFSDLVAEARKRAHALQKMGFEKGDRVALIIPDSREFVINYFGALLSGVLPVPLYPPFSLGRLDGYLRNTANVLKVARANGIVTSRRVQALLWPLTDEVRTLRDIMSVEKLGGGSTQLLDPVDVSPEDPAFIQFTSGSTREPRGVIVTHGNLVANSLCITRDGLELRPYEDRGLSWLPLYHDMGLIGFVISPLFVPLSVVFMPTMSFLKRPLQWIDKIHQHRATITFAPNFAYSLVTRRVTEEHLRRWDLSCLRAAGCGAEPISAETMRLFHERFSHAGLSEDVLFPCYGMAEATLSIAFKPLGTVWRTDVVDGDLFRSEGRAVPAKEGHDDVIEFVSCGRTFPEHSLHILDEAGNPLPERCVGEIEFRGPSVTSGYLENPEATRAAYVDGNLNTGDLGYFADGELYVSGRKKDILIVNGRNYFPQAIEWEVGEIPGVRRGNVVAFARPGSRGTEELVLVCEVRVEDTRSLEQSITSKVAGEFGLPVGDIVFLEPGALPKTTSGKLQRRKTRDMYADGTLHEARGGRAMDQREKMVKLTGHVMRAMVSRVRHTVRKVFSSDE